MQIRKMLGSAKYIGACGLAAGLMLLLPLTASAKNVLVLEFDNFFALDGAPADDNIVAQIKVKVGDTITFENVGATDHDANNDVIDIDGTTFFEGEIFGNESPTQAPGAKFTTQPFETPGEIPFFCKIHGREDMAGVVIITGGDEPGPGPGPGPGPEPGPKPGKSFSFVCDQAMNIGPAGLETIFMNVGDTESCLLKLANNIPGVNVEVAAVLRAGFKTSISIDPVSAMTDENGEILVTITAENPGIDWAAWAVPNDRGEIVFNKRAYDKGRAWGMFIDVE